MKTLLAICMMFIAPFVWAGETPTAAVVTGVVLEVKDVESYTYLRLKNKDGEIWAAVSKVAVKKGAQVTIENVTVMNNFESKSLKKTFTTIVFGTVRGSTGTSQPVSKDLANPHTGATAAKTADIADVVVPKASGPNARTVEEIVTKGSELKDKSVLVRGKVVKYNPAIMGKNWIHLRDGSGSAAKNSNDILVTTADQAKLGDILTVKGIVRTDKDFGSGYAYKVLIEEATLQDKAARSD